MALALKITHSNVTRKLLLDSAPLDWASLESAVKTRFGFESTARFTLSFVDADGDAITINTDEEVRETFSGPVQPTRFTVRLLDVNSGLTAVDMTCSTPIPTQNSFELEDNADLESLLSANEHSDANEFVVVDQEDKEKGPQLVDSDNQDPPSPVIAPTASLPQSTSTPSLTSTEPLFESPTLEAADPPVEELPQSPPLSSLHEIIAAPLDRLKNFFSQRLGTRNDLLALIDERRRHSFAREFANEVNGFVAEVVNAVRIEARQETRPFGVEEETGAAEENAEDNTSAPTPLAPTAIPTPVPSTSTTNAVPPSSSATNAVPSSSPGAHNRFRRAAEYHEAVQNAHAHHHHRLAAHAQRGRARGPGGLFAAPGRPTATPVPFVNPTSTAQSSQTVPPPTSQTPATAPPVDQSSYSTPMPGSFHPTPNHTGFPIPHFQGLFGPSNPQGLFRPSNPPFGFWSSSPPSYRPSYPSPSQVPAPTSAPTPAQHRGNSYPAHQHGASSVARVGIQQLVQKLREMGFGDNELALRIACERVLSDNQYAAMDELVRKVLNLIL